MQQGFANINGSLEQISGQVVLPHIPVLHCLFVPL
jgi:hypothetical protein